MVPKLQQNLSPGERCILKFLRPRSPAVADVTPSEFGCWEDLHHCVNAVTGKKPTWAEKGKDRLIIPPKMPKLIPADDDEDPFDGLAPALILDDDLDEDDIHLDDVDLVRSTPPPIDRRVLASAADRKAWQHEYLQDPRLASTVRTLMAPAKAAASPPQNYTWEGGLLRWKGRICVPKGLQHEFLERAHGDKTHLGVRRMWYRLAFFHWKGMHSDIRSFCRSCPCCQRNKSVTQKPMGERKPIPPAKKYGERLHIDFVGDWPCSHGFNHILTCVDAFSKQAWAIPCHKNHPTKCSQGVNPLHTATAEGVAFMLTNYVFPNTGIPEQIISDNGSQFDSDLIKCWTKWFGINHHFITAYHPQANGQVESFHLDVNKNIRVAIDAAGSIRDWPKHIGLVCCIHNQEVQASIGRSPHEVVTGECPNSLADVALSALGVTSTKTPDWEDRAKQMQEVRHEVHKALSKTEARIKAQLVKQTKPDATKP